MMKQNTPQTIHILLVEDDPAIATSLKITFKRENWQITWLDHANGVLDILQKFYQDKQPLSAIILDVGLPDGDGFNLCQQIRHSQEIGRFANLPIIFLTAKNEEVERILGLEMGADDYCTKPFSPRELVARLKAIWRRQSTTLTSLEHAILPENTNDKQLSEQVFQLESGVWRYQPQNFSLYWQEQKLELSNTERKLLLALLQSPQQVFSRGQLLYAISDHPDHRLARTIDSHIKSIRRQLSQIDASIEVIFTHRGLGYGLCRT